MKRFLFFLLLGIPVLLNAQNRSRAGYLVKDKDTVRGFIIINETDLTPTSLKFSTVENGKTSNYTVADCSAFGVAGYRSFERFLTKISLSSADQANLTVGADSTSRTAMVFLEKLTSGKHVSLYRYTDKIKTRYYLLERDSFAPTELVRRIYLDPEAKNLKIVEDAYKSQLFDLAKKYKGVSSPEEIRRITYTASALSKYVAFLNETTFIEHVAVKPKLFAGIGLNVSKGYYDGATDFTNNETVTKTSYFPMLNAGLDLYANPVTKRLVYRVELSLLMSQNKISTTTADVSKAALSHQFDQFSIALTPQLLYNFYNTEKLKIFGSAGAALNFSSYQHNISSRTNSFRNETTETPDQVKIHSFNFAFQGLAGARINDRFEIAAGYTFPSALAEFAAYSLMMKRYRVGLSYFFN